MILKLYSILYIYIQRNCIIFTPLLHTINHSYFLSGSLNSLFHLLHQSNAHHRIKLESKIYIFFLKDTYITVVLYITTVLYDLYLINNDLPSVFNDCDCVKH